MYIYKFMVLKVLQYITNILLLIFAQQGVEAQCMPQHTAHYNAFTQSLDHTIPLQHFNAPTTNFSRFFFFEEEEDVETHEHTDIKYLPELVKKAPFCIEKLAITTPPLVSNHQLELYHGAIKCAMPEQQIMHCTYRI